MYLKLIGVVLIVLSFGSCNSTKTAFQSTPKVNSNDYNYITSKYNKDSVKIVNSIDPVEVIIPKQPERPINEVVEEISLADEIVALAKEFIGIKYKSGGTSKSGMDCSGMVYSTFKKKEITVPRSSSGLASYGQKTKKNEAQPGDLIFFKTRGKKVINHVGIITEVTNDDIKFIHASVHLGVIISSLSEDYYTRAFAKINRVID